MSNTKTILDFLRETRNGLDSLTDRLASIRYDLAGSRPEQSKATESVSAPIPLLQDMPFTDGVEYLAGDINRALNKFNEEVEFLSNLVNHKEVAGISPTTTPLRKANL